MDPGLELLGFKGWGLWKHTSLDSRLWRIAGLRKQVRTRTINGNRSLEQPSQA